MRNEERMKDTTNKVTTNCKTRESHIEHSNPAITNGLLCQSGTTTKIVVTKLHTSTAEMNKFSLVRRDCTAGCSELTELMDGACSKSGCTN